MTYAKLNSMRIKSSFFIILFSFFSSLSLFGFSKIAFEDFLRLQEKLSTLGSLEENSESELAFLTFAETLFKENKIQYSFDDLTSVKDEHSFSRSLYAFFPGKRSDTLTIIIPMDYVAVSPLALDFQTSKVLNSKNDALSLSLSLALALSKSSLENEISVRLAFLSAENRFSFGQVGTMVGTRSLVNNLDRDVPNMVLYLSCNALPERYVLKNFASNIVSPFWLFDRILKARNATSFPLDIEANKNQLYRINLNDNPTRIEPFLHEGISGFELEGLGLSKDIESTVNNFSLFFDKFLEQNNAGFIERWDLHYFVMNIAGSFIVLREQNLLIIVLSIITFFIFAFMVFSYFRRKSFNAFVGGFFKSSLSIFTYFFACLGIWMLSGAIISIVLSLGGTPSLWVNNPQIFVLFKMFGFVFLFLPLSFLLRRITLVPETISFYGFAALLLLFCDILLFSAIDISFSYYFIWALSASVISVLIKNRYVGLLGFLIAPLGLFQFMIDLFLKPELKPFRYLLSSALNVSILCAFIILPFVLLFTRCLLLFYIRPSLKTKNLIVLSSVSLLFYILSFTVVFFISSRESSPKSITMQSSVNDVTGIGFASLQALSKLGSLTFTVNSLSTNFTENSDTKKLDFIDEKNIISLKKSETFFLGRKRIVANILAKGNPYKISLSLKSKDNLVIYDSNFPFTYGSQGNTLVFQIGINPKLPLVVDFTLQENQTLSYEVYAYYIDKNTNLTLSSYSGNVIQSKEVYHLFD